MATFNVTSANNTGAGSLAQAIANANAAAGADEIVFASGLTINLTSALPEITDTVTIRGVNQLNSIVDASGITGGGRVFSATQPLTVENLTLRGGRSTDDGGGIYSDAAVTVTNSTISGNSSNSGGGGIATTAAVTVTGSTLSGNTSSGIGGGIYSNAAVTVTNSTISGNTSNSRGGGIYGYGAVAIANSTLSNNRSTILGGGVFGYVAVTVTNSTLSSNTGNSGGGGIRGGGAVAVTDSTLSGNTSLNTGGGIYGYGAVTVTNSTISGNSSANSGGGIHSRDALTVTDSTISSNSSSIGNGGGIYSVGALMVTNTTLSSNSSNGNGGGIHGRGALTVTNGILSNNRSDGRGGGIYGFRGVTVANSTLSSNSSATRGGGIATLTAVMVTNSTLSSNSSNGSGGGIYGGSRAVTVTNSTISGNSSNGFGGGIRGGADAVTVADSTISGNSSSMSGGGIFGGTALTVTNSTLSGNSSNGSGGGLSAIAPITVTDSTISGNTATGGGGVDHLGLLTLTNSTLSGNSTSGDGGGIFSTSGGANINNSTIVQNTAAGRGGGIFRSDGAIAIQNSIVAGNTNNGGVSPNVFGNAINGANNNIVGSTTGLASGSLGMGSDTTLGAAAPSTVLNTTLTNNGGPTQTHALIDGGIAINGAGTGATTQDQRGFGLSGTRDIGAFELRNQEINVSGNSVAIANNDTTPDTADDTDFGGVNVNSGSITKTFTIENQGDLPLGFAGSPFATITGTNAEDFTITDLAIASLTGRGSTTFQVTFDPSSVGTRTATVSFVTDDNDESPFTFAIQGEGTTGAVASSISAPPLPGVAIAPPVVNPPKPIQGFSSALAQEPFTITNPNSTPLNLSAISLSENSNIFSIFPTAATVNPGETATFFAQLTDDVLPGTYTTTVTIPSPSGDPITFNLSGIVTLPTAFQVAPIFEATLPSDTPIWTNGDDVLIGANIDSDGRQWLNGGPGNDQIFGNLERDVLTGGTGDDSIFGGKGDDWIKGGDGDDTLAGDFGDDTLIGGLGSDRFIIGAGRGSDEILDYADGVDGFLLEPTVTFDQLTLEGLGNSMQIKFGDELLVTVIGVGRSLLDSSDFAPIG